MTWFVSAVETFFDYLTTVDWRWLALAAGVHVLRAGCRSRAWRNIIAAAYPDVPVRWRHIAGAYLAGVGVNALLPARGGDAVRLFLAKRSVPGATYPTLVSTMAVESIFDLAASLALLAWALERGALPGLDVLPRLRAFDLNWIIDHPVATAAIVTGLLFAIALAVVRARRRLVGLKERLAQGFAVLRHKRRYLQGVLAWQAIEWMLRIVGTYCYLKAFRVGFDLGLDFDIENALLVQVTQSISTVIPLTPAGIGTEQALVVYVLRGRATVTALVSFSVGTTIVGIVVNTAVGFVAITLMLRTFRWRRQVERAKRERAKETEIPGAHRHPGG